MNIVILIALLILISVLPVIAALLAFGPHAALVTGLFPLLTLIAILTAFYFLSSI